MEGQLGKAISVWATTTIDIRSFGFIKRKTGCGRGGTSGLLFAKLLGPVKAPINRQRFRINPEVEKFNRLFKNWVRVLLGIFRK